jgi:hypothetical protein
MSPEPTLQGELLSYLGQLGSDDQARVVDFARTLADSKATKRVGVPGKDLLRFAGTIPHDDLMEMQQAIEEDCERIFPSEWQIRSRYQSRDCLSRSRADRLGKDVRGR